MDAATPAAVKRLRIEIDSPAGAGVMAGIEFGPQDRPYDVVFLHANGFNAMTYRSILAPLGQEMRILAVDQRGHGLSELEADPEGRTNWELFREDLLALLRVIGGPPVVLSGHSMGGCVSLLTAVVAPERVKRMVFFDPVIMARGMGQRLKEQGSEGGAMNDSPLLQGALRRRAVFDSKAAVIQSFQGRGAFKTWSAEQLSDYVEDGFKDRPEGGVELTCSPLWEAANFASHAHDPWPALDQFPRPIRIFRAEEGSTARIDDDLATLTADGRVTVETIPGTTHFLPMERVDLVHASLREAVSSP